MKLPIADCQLPIAGRAALRCRRGDWRLSGAADRQVSPTIGNYPILNPQSSIGNSAFTLIELMVVIAIIGIMTAMMIPEMKGTFQDALLRSTSRELINVFDLAYSRAISLNQIRRVSLDEKSGRYLVEKQISENGREIFVPADDVPGSKGELDSRIAVEIHSPDEIPAEGIAAAAENTFGGTAIDFYPDGTADAGDILLRDREGFRLLLHINPVTARVHVVEMEREAAR
jgi:prepilin-type N-terminal cleavage/methylation domain-containing protein